MGMPVFLYQAPHLREVHCANFEDVLRAVVTESYGEGREEVKGKQEKVENTEGLTLLREAEPHFQTEVRLMIDTDESRQRCGVWFLLDLA